MPAKASEDELVSRIVRSERILLRGLVRTVRKADGMTLQQTALMGILSRSGPSAMNRLGEELMVTPPNVTGIVDRLEEKGLVVRRPSPEDRRRTEIALTKKGEKLRTRVSNDYRASLSSALDSLTESERETLASLLERLAEASRKSGTSP